MKFIKSIFIFLFSFVILTQSAFAIPISNCTISNCDKMEELLKINLSLLQETKDILLKNKRHSYSKEEQLKLIKEIDKEIVLLRKSIKEHK